MLYPIRGIVMAIEPFIGLQTVGLHQELSLEHIDIAGDIMGIVLSELAYGVGPLIGVMSTFNLGRGIALRGEFAASTPVMSDRLKQKDYYWAIGSTANTYGLNMKGSNVRPVLGTNLDLDLVYRYDIHRQENNDFSIEAVFGWSLAQYFYMVSMMQATTDQGSQPGTFVNNGVKGGLSFIF